MGENSLSFFIPITPKPLARPRASIIAGRVRVYDSKVQREYNKKMIDALLPFAPEKPLRGPIRLFMKAWLAVPPSWTKAQQKAAIAGVFLPIKKPDTSNLLKLAEDRMTDAGFWEDDCQVVYAEAGKLYSDEPGWSVTIEYQEEFND